MSDYYYILDDEGNPQPTNDHYAWGAWFESADRTIARDAVGSAEVSTVFLSLNHQWGDGPPVLFETLVFLKNEDGGLDAVEGSMRRYETREQALSGHAEVLESLKGGIMSNVPAWQDEFDRRFNNNFVYWQELAAEIHIGDPDFNSVRDFIRDLLAEKDAEIEDLLTWARRAYKLLGNLGALTVADTLDVVEMRRSAPDGVKGES